MKSFSPPSLVHVQYLRVYFSDSKLVLITSQEVPIDLEVTKEDISGPSSISSDQASLCVIPDPDDSLEEDGFIYLDKSGLPANLSLSEQDRTVVSEMSLVPIMSIYHCMTNMKILIL